MSARKAKAQVPTAGPRVDGAAAADSYHAFVGSKLALRTERAGVDVPDGVSLALFPFQRDLVRWALATGKAALYHEVMAREMAAATRRAVVRVDNRAAAYEPAGSYELAPWVQAQPENDR